METRLDELSKVLGSGVSRRAALKFVGASALGAMLSTLGVKQAEAVGNRACRDAGDPPCTEIGCHGAAPPDLNCGCIPKTGRGKGMCHECVLCSGLIACTKSSQCRERLGRAWKCATSCCGTFCHPVCGKGFGQCGAGSGKTSLG